MTPLFEPDQAKFMEIANSDRVYPVNRIFCVGRNYEAHAREMGKNPDREPPFFFTKWADALLPSQQTVPYPIGTENYHFEIELVVAISKEGQSIPAARAKDHVFGYATGLDMTRRDLQLSAREKGRPWDTGKNFPESAPMGMLHMASDIGHLTHGRITLEVNGEVKQDADIADLIWSVDEIISHLSHLYTLRPGDLIMTGTPAGVGPVIAGDTLIGKIDGLSSVELSIGA